MRLLIVDDDTHAAEHLASGLEGFGHETVIAADGRAALTLAAGGGFDAVLLDVMLPFVDGLEVIRLLRERRIGVPIVILTALGELDQRIAGLNAGADDYLVKPAAPAEIDARLKAILRRTARGGDSGVMRAGDIEVSEVRFRATRGGRLLTLQKLEFLVLCELVRNADGVVTRALLYRNVWQYDSEPAANIAESYIRRLRRQLNAGGEIDPIVTLRGVGYMLKSQP